MVAPDLRPATIADSQLLFDWRNDAQTRAASGSRGELDRAAHEHWVVASLASATRVIYLAEVEGAPVGMCRFDDHGDSVEVSIALAPAARGQGLAGPLLAAAQARYRDERGMPVRFVARIRPDNGPSIRIFARLGYVRVGSDGELDRFELPS